MIPNSAPMAAVYLTADRELFSRPVAAWSDSANALVIYDQGETRLLRADYSGHSAEFLGLWQCGWTPSYDQMASLLPEHTPGTPHPLATPVTVKEIPGGWAAFREDGARIAEAVTYHRLEARLSAIGSFRINSMRGLSDED